MRAVAEGLIRVGDRAAAPVAFESGARDGTAARPSAGPLVSVRGGDHPGFGRVVFGWRLPVGYTVSRAGDVVIVSFDRAADFDLARFNARLPKYVHAARSEGHGIGSRVTLLIDPEGRLRHFRAGTTVVLDVIAARQITAATTEPPPPAPAKAKPPPPPDARPAPQASNAAPQASNAAPRASDAAPPASDSAPQAPPEANNKPAASAKAESEPPAGVDEPLVPPVEAASPPAESPPADSNAPANMVDEAGSSRDATAAEPMALVGPAVADEPAPAPRPVAARSLGTTAAEMALTPPPMVVKLRTVGEPTLVSFNGGRMLASAAFIRARHLWVVFSAAYSVDLEPARGAANPAYDSVVQVAHPRATVLRFKLREGFGAGFRRRGTLWIAQFTKQPEPPVAIAMRIEDGSHGQHVYLQLANVADEIELRDPGDGATLIVVPVAASGAGVVSGRRLPAFDLLPTVQGIVVRPAAEGVTVLAGSGGVEIGLAGSLSGARGKQRPTRVAPRPGADVAVFDLAVWRRGSAAEFADTRRELQLAAATARPTRRTSARIDLARLLFAHGYFAETLSVLELVMADDPPEAELATLGAMRGVAQLMLDHLGDAAADLDKAELDGYDDIALWRGVLAMRQGATEVAAEYFARAGSLWLHDLVPHLRDQIGLIAAEAAIEVRDLAAATGYLDAIHATRPMPSIRDRARYLRGRALWAAGNQEEALEQWKESAQSSDRLVRAGTLFQRTAMLLESGELTAREAIEVLETLRFAWRGDGFELKLLQRLAELYVGEKSYRKALEAMKQAATYYAGHPIAAALAADMNQLFTDMFLDGGADELPAREALTLYYDFRELTPPGAAGDKVIRALADRLAAVDLLDRAASLLDHQVNYRLKGVEKARVGVRLAVLRLMDLRPEAALKALDSSAVGRPSRDLATQRRHVRARALADLGRNDKALKLLARDASRDAALLRADIHWRSGDWSSAAAATQYVLEKTSVEVPLSLFASRQILRLAVALVLAHDRTALKKMRRRYAEVMKGGADRDAFELISSTVDRKRLSFRELPAAVAQVASFEAFMASYRERVRSQSLSAIN